MAAARAVVSDDLSPGRMDERLGQLEDRADKHDEDTKELRNVVTSVDKRLEGMAGELRGALHASKMSGAVVAALITSGASAAVGLLVWVLGRLVRP